MAMHRGACPWNETQAFVVARRGARLTSDRSREKLTSSQGCDESS
jgi:hypothetical protein